jgi:hypothetical protein
LNKNLQNNVILSFLIGFLSAYPSILPTIISLKKNPTCDLYNKAKLEDMSLYLPFFYGILHVILIWIIVNALPKAYQTYWFLGVIIGLFYPTLGTISGHAKKIYGIESTFMLYLGAQFMYQSFYVIMMGNMVELL